MLTCDGSQCCVVETGTSCEGAVRLNNYTMGIAVRNEVALLAPWVKL